MFRNLKACLIGPSVAIVAAVVALGVLVVPAFALNTTQQVLCSISATGANSTYTLTQTTCGGTVAWPPANGMNSLQLIVFGRCASTFVDTDAVLIDLNNDAAAHYAYQETNAGSAPTLQTGQTTMKIGDIPCHHDSNAHEPGGIITDIPFSVSGAYNKVVSSRDTFQGPSFSATFQPYGQTIAGLWYPSTAVAISRIDVGTASGTVFDQYTHVELIGY